jgi:two-component system cell cycle response regulator
LSATRILVIEDNPANMELVRYVLENFGYTVIAAVDGETGVALARTESPDLVVCDLQLPGINGIEVNRRIRAQPALAHIPLIAVTAYAMVGDRERVLAAGFDGYISKPIDPQTFVPQIAAFLKSPPPKPVPRPDSVAAPPAPTPEARARVLVLDDSPSNLELFTSLLEPHGIAVSTAGHIEEAFARLADFLPDLIVSDIHIGRERGIDFFTQVKARAEMAQIPFIFISSTALQVTERMRKLTAGADRFLVRPIDGALLLAEVEACLALRKVA